MRGFSKIALLTLVFAFGLEVAAARSRVIHNWTINTPLGEFGYIEIGSDGFPSEGDFLFGRFGYIQTGLGSSSVLAGSCVLLVVVVAVAGWNTCRLIRNRQK